jgi:hypothetical protein
MSEDCYIFWDDKYVYIQCLECHEKNGQGVKWHANMGYKNKVVCSQQGCGKVIHQGEDEQDQTTVQES